MKTEYELPLIWNWTSGQNGGTGTSQPTPTWQRERIEQDGWPIMPHVELMAQQDWSRCGPYSRPAFEVAKERGLPLAFVGDNICDWFSRYPEFADNDDPNKPEDHAWLVKVKGDGSLVTSKSHLSWYSEHTPRWAYRLGYLIGTCEQIVKAAEIYPAPPFVYVFDNNEAVFENLKVPERDVREGSDDEVARLRKWHDRYQPSSEFEAKLIQRFMDGIDGTFHGEMKRHVWLKLNQGFRDGLASHNEHWAAAAGLCAYRHMATPSYQQANLVNNDGTPRLSFPSHDFAIQGHRFGVTGGMYFQPWYGEWDSERAWTDINNEVFAREAAAMQYGDPGPRRACLLWEGRWREQDNEAMSKPSREHWRAFVRSAMWMTRAELAGHFAESNTPTGSEKISIYYDEVRRAAEEVRDPLLSAFWKHGKLLRGIDQNVKLKQHIVPTVNAGYDYYWQHVVEEWRYKPDTRGSQEYIDKLSNGSNADAARLYLQRLSRSQDGWRSDLTSRQNFDFACFGIQLGGQVLFFVAQVLGNRTQPITVKADIDGTIRDITFEQAVAGGEFWVYDINTKQLTSEIAEIV